MQELNTFPHFPSLGEFQFISTLLSGSPVADIPLGPGDDCAIVGDWLISTDLSIESVHFRLDWSTMHESVTKAFLSNLSDVNAMGGTTQLALLNLNLNQNWSDAQKQELTQALHSGLQKHQVALIGGDTVASGQGGFGFTVFGKLPEGASPLLRSNVRAGDYIYLGGGFPGLAGLGLQQLLRNDPFDPVSFALHKCPSPPLTLGPWLASQRQGHAAIDVSDGLANELHHLALSSGVSLVIDSERLPIHPAIEKACARWGVSVLDMLLQGGEDYLLIFASRFPPSLLVLPKDAPMVTCIGTAEAGHGVWLQETNGNRSMIYPKAWSHL